MKKLLIITFILILGVCAFAQEKQGKVAFKIKEGTVIDNYENHPADKSAFSIVNHNYLASLKLGAFTNGFGLDFKGAMAEAGKLKLDCMELASTSDLDILKPLNVAQVKMIKDEFEKYNMTISSLCAEVGGFNIADIDETAKRVEAVKICADNAKKLGCNMIQLHFGVINFSKDDARYVGNKNSKKGRQGNPDKNFIKAVKEIDAYCYKNNIKIAQETGPQEGYMLARFIKDNGLKATFVNFDAANLVMYNFNEIKSLEQLKDYVIQVHLKDGFRDTVKTGYVETGFGGGDVRWNELMDTFRKINYKGNMIIEREISDDFINGITESAEFIRR